MSEPTGWSDLAQRYADWFISAMAVKEFGQFAELTTPFLDRHNDYIQVYVSRTRIGGYVVTDDGGSIAELEASGVDITSTKTRSEVFGSILQGFKIRQLSNGALAATATDDDLAERINDLLQAVMAVQDLYVLARRRVARMFYEDVEVFLEQAGAVFAARESVPGKSGYKQRVDFLLPPVNGTPTRILQAVQNPAKTFVEHQIFLIEDVRPALPEMRPYALLNDRDFEIPGETYAAFDQYNIRAVGWSQRETIQRELVGASAKD